MREAVKILLGDNERAVERHLPIHLEEIKDIAEEVNNFKAHISLILIKTVSVYKTC